MGLFKKKNNEPDSEQLENAQQAADGSIEKASKKKDKKKDDKSEAAFDYKTALLEALNEKLKGNIFDDCLILPRGFTIDVQVGKTGAADGVVMLQAIFLVRHDDFDEPLIEPVDAQGQTEADAAKMAVDMFFGAVWHPLDQALTKKNPVRFSVDYLNQHYDFDMYCQSVVRIGMADRKPTMLMEYIKSDIPKYLGSKKYYWIRVYLCKYQDKQVVEVRVNGSVCAELSKRYQLYVDSWTADDAFISEKQYAIFVQTEDDQCPFEKDVVIQSGKSAIESMVKITNADEYKEFAQKFEAQVTEKVAENLDDAQAAALVGKSLAAEIRIFIPEILAKLTLMYNEGDSLFLLEGEGEEQQSIEFKKTQLRSYFYLQQVCLEYLSTRPSKEDVTKIVTNSVAFREMRKIFDQLKEQGKEVQPNELFVPGTSYKIAVEGYKVW